MLRQASASGKAPTEQRPGSASAPAGWADWQGANWQLPSAFASYAGPVPTHGIPPGFALVPPGVLVPLDALHVRPAVLFISCDAVLLTGILTMFWAHSMITKPCHGGFCIFSLLLHCRPKPCCPSHSASTSPALQVCVPVQNMHVMCARSSCT